MIRSEKFERFVQAFFDKNKRDFKNFNPEIVIRAAEALWNRGYRTPKKFDDYGHETLAFVFINLGISDWMLDRRKKK